MTALKESCEGFFGQPQHEARRVFHGRGRCFTGLEHITLDWYPPLLLISLHEARSDEQYIVDLLRRADSLGQIQQLVLQRRFEIGAPARCVFGQWPKSLVVQEDGLLFEVSPGRQQNAGLFLDMRPLRQWLRDHSAGCKVLNLFAYSCALSVAALAGGAASVTNVDISKSSIAWGRRNHLLNKQPTEQVKEIPYNLFTSWGRIRQYGRYDLVIVDPPTRQRGSFDARRDYGAVLRKLSKLCNPGATLAAALNSPFLDFAFLEQCLEQNLPGVEILGRLPAAAEFKEAEPDKGLKLLLARLP